MVSITEMKENLPELIIADSVMIEVIDKITGRVYRREIPLEYKETDNGIILVGENAHGSRSEIVFLSCEAMNRMKDIMGKGPDEHHCD